MQLTFCENQLKTKQKDVGANSGDYEKDQVNLKKTEKEVAQLEVLVVLTLCLIILISFGYKA